MKKIFFICLLMSGSVFSTYASSGLSRNVAKEVVKEDITLTDTEKKKVLMEAKKVDAVIVTKFNGLIASWDKEIYSNPKTLLSSSTLEYTKLPEFASLKSMGTVIIPLIMEKLLDEKNYYLLSLYDTLQKDNSLKATCKDGEQNRARRTIRLWINSLK